MFRRRIVLLGVLAGLLIAAVTTFVRFTPAPSPTTTHQPHNLDQLRHKLTDAGFHVVDIYDDNDAMTSIVVTIELACQDDKRQMFTTEDSPNAAPQLAIKYIADTVDHLVHWKTATFATQPTPAEINTYHLCPDQPPPGADPSKVEALYKQAGFEVLHGSVDTKDGITMMIDLHCNGERSRRAYTSNNTDTILTIPGKSDVYDFAGQPSEKQIRDLGLCDRED